MFHYAKLHGIVQFIEETDEINIINQTQALLKVRFLKELTQCYIDTYFVVASTLYALMETSTTIEQNKLTSELHACIKTLHKKGALRYLNSCQKSSIDMAFASFSSLGACQRLVFDSHGGTKIAYIKCLPESKENLS